MTASQFRFLLTIITVGVFAGFLIAPTFASALALLLVGLVDVFAALTVR